MRVREQGRCGRVVGGGCLGGWEVGNPGPNQPARRKWWERVKMAW